MLPARPDKDPNTLILSIFIGSHYTNKAKLDSSKIANSFAGKVMLISLLLTTFFFFNKVIRLRKQQNKKINLHVLISSQ